MIKIGEHKREILYWIYIWIIWFLVVNLVSYLQTKSSVYSDYFEYTKIVSVKDRYDIGEDIIFNSVLDRYEVTDMKYVDILKCTIWDEEIWYSQGVTYSKWLTPWLYDKLWRYDGELPNTNASCYLDSSPTVLLNYGIEKTQKLESNIFTIWE